jgi:hypothetical protein
MAKSTKQLQAESLAFLGRIGADAKTLERASNGALGLEYYLQISAANFILKVQENLNNLNKVDTGKLSGELTQTAVVKNGSELSMQIGYPSDSEAAKYYDYVNKGVMGFESNQPNSKYKYKKKLNRKGGILIGNSMRDNILAWMLRNGVRPTEKYQITQREKRSASLSKMLSETQKKKSLAYAVAVNIKKKGIEKTGYFDNAIEYSFGKDFINTISQILGQEIVLNIKATQPDGNNNQ